MQDLIYVQQLVPGRDTKKSLKDASSVEEADDGEVHASEFDDVGDPESAGALGGRGNPKDLDLFDDVRDLDDLENPDQSNDIGELDDNEDLADIDGLSDMEDFIDYDNISDNGDDSDSEDGNESEDDDDPNDPDNSETVYDTESQSDAVHYSDKEVSPLAIRKKRSYSMLDSGEESTSSKRSRTRK